MRKRAAVQETQKDAIITLKHSNQVIAIPTNLIAVGVVPGIPDKTTLIPSNKPVKTIISVRNVTGATPDRITSFPMFPGALKVCAKETIRPLPPLATLPAVPGPEPKWKVIA
jgi:hypothetical protein